LVSNELKQAKIVGTQGDNEGDLMQFEFGHPQMSDKHRRQLLKFSELEPPYLNLSEQASKARKFLFKFINYLEII
jgi:hypothetical protein